MLHCFGSVFETDCGLLTIVMICLLNAGGGHAIFFNHRSWVGG